MANETVALQLSTPQQDSGAWTFQLLQQSWEDEMKFNAQDLEASKSALTEAQSQLTTDTADIKMTKEDALAEDTAAPVNIKQDCHAKRGIRGSHQQSV